MINKYDKFVILLLSVLMISMSIMIYILYNYEIIPENAINYEGYDTVRG